MNKKLLIGIGALVVILVLVAVFKKSGGEEEAGVTSQNPITTTIVSTVIANGNITPAQDVKISSDVSGEIVQLPVKEGDKVKAGDLLVEINPDIYRSAANRANASLMVSKANYASSKSRLAQSKAQLVTAENTFKRNKQLFADKALSKSELEQAESSFLVAKAEVEAAQQAVISNEYQVKSAEASSKEAGDNLRRTKIFAPTDGTISSLNVESGERVVGTNQMTGTEIMRVSDMSVLEVEVDVNETDIIAVKLGDTTLVEVDSYLNQQFKGVVTEIANAARSQGAGADVVTNFPVKITLLPDSYKELMVGKPSHFSPFRPGMSASVEIITESRKDILAIPIEAVTTRQDSFKTSATYTAKKELENVDPFECVFVIEEGKAKIKRVKTGIQDSRNIQILEGLTAEDKVITGPYSTVSKLLYHNKSVEKKGKAE